MDNFAEQLVKKQNTGSDRLKTMLILIGGGLITLFFLVTAFLTLGSGLFAFFGAILAIAAALLTFRAFKNTHVEYEYTYTNGELDIDKIIDQRKRREMLTIDVRRFTDFGKYDENTPEETAEMTIVMATDNIASHEYYADFPSDEFGSARLVFSPDEKMLENIIKGLPTQLRRKMNEQKIRSDSQQNN